ncbi:LysR family transcriptional regulator [Actinocatenispora rupis]|uniref:LysR family transcriptional regulator n=1 Tax=Actinocatenispora rupis TaxID=519421 RepID=A0A8J3J4W6_9ACTN|nr:LysR family transcriptional regulator [Actinocatenispora rupis]GID11671.1 LysR family transcriptional regulator [Actinocatenispora rupis]
MNPSHLRGFLAVLRAGGVTAAAARLGVAPSSVSGQVRALERDLGVRLFDRTGAGMRPTRAGQRLGRHAEDLLGYVERVRAEVTGRHAGVRVGALETLVAGLLPEMLDRLADRHPDLTVLARPMQRGALLAALAADDLDAGLFLDTGDTLGGLGFAPPPGTTLDFLDVADVPLVLVGAPDRPEGPLLCTEPGCSFWLAADRVLGTAADRVELGTVGVIRAWAAGGRGHALLPEFAVADDLATGRLVRLPQPAAAPLSLRLAWRTGRDRTDADLRAVLYALSA